MSRNGVYIHLKLGILISFFHSNIITVTLLIAEWQARVDLTFLGDVGS